MSRDTAIDAVVTRLHGIHDAADVITRAVNHLRARIGQLLLEIDAMLLGDEEPER